MLLDALDAAVRVAGDDGAAVTETVCVELVPDRPDGGIGHATKDIGARLTVLRWLDVSAEMLGNVSAPALQQIFDQPRRGRCIRTPGPKEVADRGGAQL